jgi:hypothetical protein
MAMSVAKLDESIVPILENATERVVIRASDGRVLGVFHPSSMDAAVSLSPNSDEQLRELQRNKAPGVSLDEFWQRLEVK